MAAVALVLAPIPWLGYRYVKEMEGVLREGQEQALVATARAVATALHDRPELLELRPRGRVSGRLGAAALAQCRLKPRASLQEARPHFPKASQRPCQHESRLWLVL